MSNNSFRKLRPLTCVSPAQTEQALCSAGKPQLQPQPPAQRNPERNVTVRQELIGVGEKTMQSVELPPIFSSSHARGELEERPETELVSHRPAQRKTVHIFGIRLLQSDKLSQLSRSKCFLLNKTAGLIARAKRIFQEKRALSRRQMKAEKIAADIKLHLSVNALEANKKTKDAIREHLKMQEVVKTLERYKMEMNKNPRELNTNAMRFSDELEEFERKARAVEAQEQELDMMEERLRERREKVENFEEVIKTAKAQHDKVSQENEAINHDLEAAASGQAQTKFNNQKIKQLEAEYDALLVKKKEWEERAANKSEKNIGRLQQLQAFQKKRLEEQEAKAREKDQQIEMTNFKKEQKVQIQQAQNQLHKKAANRVRLCIETEKGEAELEDSYASRTREQLLTSRVTAGIQNYFERLAGPHERAASITDTVKQMDMIHNLFQLVENEVQQSKNANSEPD